MSLAKRLWEENKDLAAQALTHPFIEGIRSGTLSIERFQRYLAQDVPFMEATVDVYQAILDRIDYSGVDSMSNLLNGAIEELQSQKAKQIAGGSELLPAAQTYIDFMYANTATPDIGQALAAIIPCVRLYAFLGQELLSGTSLHQHPYADWIQAYGSPEVETMAVQLEELIDRNVTNDVSDTYRQGMVLEIEFFNALM